MKYFDNYKIVDLDMLRKSGIYTEQILAAIENNDKVALAEDAIISKEQREDINFMAPIVYAFKKAHKTFIAYTACGSNLQKKVEFAKDIIKEEPEIIMGTSASDDREFIAQVAREKPEVIKYMSSTLKSDVEFTGQLCELNIPEVTTCAAQECKMPDTIEKNPALANNKDFMFGIIKNDPNTLEYASEELKNDYKFIKDACQEQEDVIKYISEHTEEFGTESLKGAQEVLKDKFNDKLEQDCNEEVEKIKKEIEDKKQQGIDVEPKLEYRVKNLEKRPERIKARIAKIEEGDEKALRFAKKVLKNCNLDNKYREMLEHALNIGEAIREKQKENEGKVNEQGAEKITLENIEKTVEGAKMPGIQEDTDTIKIGIKEQWGIRQENNELGESINDKSNDERA